MFSSLTSSPRSGVKVMILLPAFPAYRDVAGVLFLELERVDGRTGGCPELDASS